MNENMPVSLEEYGEMQKHFIDGIIKAYNIMQTNRKSDWYKESALKYPLLHRKEMLTIRAGLPRRFGNTTIVASLASQIKGSVVVCMTYDMARDLEGRNIRATCVAGLEKFIRNYVSEERKLPSALIFDTTFFLTKGELKKIYSIDADAYIMIG